jgi:hypothetical protein
MGERSLAVTSAEITSNHLMFFDCTICGTGNNSFDQIAFKIRLSIPYLRIYCYLRPISSLLFALRTRGRGIWI